MLSTTTPPTTTPMLLYVQKVQKLVISVESTESG